MTFRIGPSLCGECHEEYGHLRSCSKSPYRSENRSVSERLIDLSASDVSVKDRMDRLIRLMIELAERVEGE
jgi:hypothetical protein